MADLLDFCLPQGIVVDVFTYLELIVEVFETFLDNNNLCDYNIFLYAC